MSNEKNIRIVKGGERFIGSQDKDVRVTPLITKSSDKHMNFSRPMFYYFGLRPGKTSFDIFVNKYIDEDNSETVI